MISEREYGEFLDLAYGAALEPGSWTQVIERFADLMGGAKAWMPSLKLRDGSGDGLLARIDPREQDAYFAGRSSLSSNTRAYPPTNTSLSICENKSTR